MTRVAVMQPYFAPYAGYLQLLQAVDVFVWLDDVQFVKRRWINRNRILLQGEVHWLTLPVRSSPQSTSIREKEYDFSCRVVARVAEMLRHAYGRRPGWHSVQAFVDELGGMSVSSVSEVNEKLLEWTLGALDLPVPRLMRASSLGIGGENAQRRMIDLVLAAGGTEYVNLPGGRELYSANDFTAAGLILSFIEPNLQSYSQGWKQFVPGLSSIDIIANDAGHLVRKDIGLVIRTSIQ